jgi:ABC-type Fe3+ transport system substrate-binding protein
MSFNTRRFLITLILLSFLVLPLACRSSGISEGKSLLIYTPHGQDLLKDFVARYREAHPEVNVQFIDMGSREVLARLRTEHNRPQADAIVKGAPHEEEARRFYEFVNTPVNLIYAAHNYYRIPARTDLDRSQLPAWMNEPFTRMPLDWELLSRESNEWLRYWDTEIRKR